MVFHFSRQDRTREYRHGKPFWSSTTAPPTPHAYSSQCINVTLRHFCPLPFKLPQVVRVPSLLFWSRLHKRLRVILRLGLGGACIIIGQHTNNVHMVIPALACISILSSYKSSYYWFLGASGKGKGAPSRWSGHPVSSISCVSTTVRYLFFWIIALHCGAIWPTWLHDYILYILHRLTQ